MNKERKNVAVDIVNFNIKKYGDFRYLPLYNLTQDDVLWVIFDDSGKIYYEKILNKPKTPSGRTRQRNTIQKRVNSVLKEKGTSISWSMIDSSRTFYELDKYFSLHKLDKLAGEYEKELYDSKNKDFNEKFKLDHRMKVGETYYIYYPTRGDISEPKSYVAHTFNSLDPLSDGAVYRLTTGGHTLTSINYNKLSDKFKKKEIMTDSDYVAWGLNSGFSSPKDIHDKDDIRQLKEAVDTFKSDKSKDNREALRLFLLSFVKKTKDRAMDGDFTLITPFIEANMALPFTARLELYGLFVENASDVSFSGYINSDRLPKPVWDYLPANAKKKIYQKKIPFVMNPSDKNLNDILGRFTGKDDLRPIQTAINIEESGATATDAHQLVHIAGEKSGDFEYGNYHTLKHMKKWYKEWQMQGVKDLPNFEDFYKKNRVEEGNYPNWKAVIPNIYGSIETVDVNLPFLASVIETLKVSKLLHNVTDTVVLDLKSDNGREDGYMNLGFNANLFVNVAKGMMELGIIEASIHFSMPNKAIIITKRMKWGITDPINFDFGLLMPVMLSGNEYSTIKIEEANKFKIKVGTTDWKTLTNRQFYGTEEKTDSKPTIKKQPAKKSTPKAKEKTPSKESKKPNKTDKKVFLNNKIEAFEMILEMEANKDKISFLKDKIEAFKLMLDI